MQYEDNATQTVLGKLEFVYAEEWSVTHELQRFYGKHCLSLIRRGQGRYMGIMIQVCQLWVMSLHIFSTSWQFEYGDTKVYLCSFA